MRRRGSENSIKCSAAFRRILIPVLILVIAAASMFTVTNAWLKRSSIANEVPGVGFQYRNSGEVMPQEFSVRTSCKKPDGTWQLITEDFVREEDESVDWTAKWDELSAFMVPGARTEYRTEIRNLTIHEKQFSVHLKDVSIEKGLKGKVSIGVYEPDVFIFESDNEALFRAFTETDESGNITEWLKAEVLCLAPECIIPKGGSAAVEWYVYLDADADGGGFPVLTDADGKPVRNGESYYSVNAVDSDGSVTEAFLCDSFGVLTVSPEGALIPYKGNLASVKCDYLTTGYSSYRVRISGMYIK